MKPAPLIAAALGSAAALALAIQALAQGAPGAATPAGGGDAQRGQQLFAAQCSLCHSNSQEAEVGAGPPLWGVVGRKAAGVAGFGYSAALKGTGWTWDDAHLDTFLANPSEAVPGTTMPVAVADPAQRKNVIAYLRQLHGLDSKAPAKPAAPSSKLDRLDSLDSRPESNRAVAKLDRLDRLDSRSESDRAAAGGPTYSDWRGDAPGRKHRITVADLPAPFASRSSGNPPQRTSRPEGALPRAPAGVKVALFADGLRNPRRLTVAPNGDVFVAETSAGRVRVLRPSADGAKGAGSTAFAERLDGPFGLALFPAGPNPQWLYVAEENRVVRFPYRTGDQQARGAPEVVVARLASTGGGHSTRDLAFSPDGKRLFVSVGSQSNVAQQIGTKPLAEAQAFDRQRGATGAAWDSEDNRAAVLVAPAAGGAAKLYATGLRNCVGMAVQPASGALWCTVNERDGLGDDLAPDYATSVKEGGFYGWPWWYIGEHEEPRLKGARPDLKGKAVVPDVLIQPHSAPMQIAFYEGAMFPAWRGSALVALHGSWNRSQRSGYKLIRMGVGGNGRAAGDYEDVLTGFVQSDAAVWGRPVGVAVAKDGSVLVSDDGGGVIWRLSR